MSNFTHDGASIPSAPAKDPDSTVDYAADWSAVIQTGETISTSQWITPPGLTASGDTVNGTTTSVFLSGGTEYESYVVTNRITTSLGRTIDRSFRVKVVQL